MQWRTSTGGARVTRKARSGWSPRVTCGRTGWRYGSGSTTSSPGPRWSRCWRSTGRIVLIWSGLVRAGKWSTVSLSTTWARLAARMWCAMYWNYCLLYHGNFLHLYTQYTRCYTLTYALSSESIRSLRRIVKCGTTVAIMQCRLLELLEGFWRDRWYSKL